MGIGSMSGRLIPMITGGGASSARSTDIPTLVTPRLPNAAGFFDDFLATAVGPAGFGEVNPSTYGHPAWQYTTLGGGGGSVGCGGSTTALGTLVAAPNSGGGFIVETPGRTTAAAGAINFGTTTKALGMWRFALSGSASSRIEGLGWVRTSLVTGTDWVTDPDTTLATTDAIVITRNASAYSGDAAGDLVARVYSTAGTDNDSAVLVTSANMGSGYRKVEVYCDGAGTLYFYHDNVLVWTKAVTALANTFYRPSFGIIPSAASRIVNVDCLYQEQSFSAAR
jgi:hypothetical protein